MRKQRVAVMFCASNVVEVDVPDDLQGEALRDHVQDKLNKELPEVLIDCAFEFPMSAQIVGDEQNFDLND